LSGFVFFWTQYIKDTYWEYAGWVKISNSSGVLLWAAINYLLRFWCTRCPWEPNCFVTLQEHARQIR